MALMGQIVFVLVAALVAGFQYVVLSTRRWFDSWLLRFFVTLKNYGRICNLTVTLAGESPGSTVV